MSNQNRTTAGPARAKHWCFTKNNYNDDYVSMLKGLDNDSGIKYLIFGYEVGESGTPHLQGFVTFIDRKRPGQVKQIIGECHITVARDVKASAEYCKKDGNFYEYGEFIGHGGQGKRTDLNFFMDAVKAASLTGFIDRKKIREEHYEVAAKYRAFFNDYILDHSNTSTNDYTLENLRDWQQQLKDILDGEAENRSIVFVVDLNGNAGKTYFCHWYEKESEKRCQIIPPGKKADMAYMLNDRPEVLFFDCPRSKQGEFVQYDFLEECKNGYVFSGKYESRVIRFKSPHIVVFMNEEPDMTKLSADRYNIIRI